MLGIEVGPFAHKTMRKCGICCMGLCVGNARSTVFRYSTKAPKHLAKQQLDLKGTVSRYKRPLIYVYEMNPPGLSSFSYV